MSTRRDASRYRTNWQDEVDSGALYEAIAAAEPQPQLAEVYRRLAAVEGSHADFWADRLRAAGQDVPARRLGWRTQIRIWLVRRFGPQFVLPTVSALEEAGAAGYGGQPESQATRLPAEEQSHARVLRALVTGTPGGLEGSALAQLEGRHRATSGNALRAAVLGASDGLLSNFSLVMGVAGAAPSGQAVLVAGLAGLLAGAFSMALGEWISVQSSRELYERQITIERGELETAPAEEQEELALIYQAKGLPEDQARALAARLIGDRSAALETLAREELGIDPTKLGGSAWEAGLTSFLLFGIGAVLPVAPFLFSGGVTAVALSVIVSGLGLFGIGAAITLLTGRNALVSGLRQMLIGFVAAGITFGIGRAIGLAVSG